MNTLIVHEWVESVGGAERVVDGFLDAFPGSDLHVLWNDVPSRYDGDVSESWISRTPLRRHKALAVPFLPLVWRTMKATRDYDFMVVSSHLFAHHARILGVNVPKLVYSHTPARYIWEPETDQRGLNPIARAASIALRPIDRHRASEAQSIAANSNFTCQRIARTWNRDSRVIYPPVRVDDVRSSAEADGRMTALDEETLAKLPSQFLLGASRLVRYKALDTVLDAASKTGIPVVIAGDGPDRNRLESVAVDLGVEAYFLGRVSDELLFRLYRAAVAFIFPSVEDFGIMPVEAMAAGAAVVVNEVGGAAESVSACRGGVTVNLSSPVDWAGVLAEVERVDRVASSRATGMFSEATFKENVRRWAKEEGLM